MAIKLNLLPPEHAVSGPLGKLLSVIRMLNVVLLAGFLIFTLGIGAYFVYSTIQLNGINSSIAGLKSQVSSQEQSEQQIVLLKDRIAKIKLIKAFPNATGNLGKVEPFVLNMGANTNLNELGVDPTRIDLSLTFRSNSELSSFLAQLKDSDTFKSIVMSTFGYNPSSGYVVGFSMI